MVENIIVFVCVTIAISLAFLLSLWLKKLIDLTWLQVVYLSLVIPLVVSGTLITIQLIREY